MKKNPDNDHFLTIFLFAMCLLSVIIYSLDYL